MWKALSYMIVNDLVGFHILLYYLRVYGPSQREQNDFS